jgi:hypothetical protein
MDAELDGIFRIFCARLDKSLLTGKDLLRLNHQTVGLVLVITEACNKVFRISSESVMKLRRSGSISGLV